MMGALCKQELDIACHIPDSGQCQSPLLLRSLLYRVKDSSQEVLPSEWAGLTTHIKTIILSLHLCAHRSFSP